MKTNPVIDSYILKSADFAKPVLMHIRKIVHEGCPEVEETWKWSFPHFMYNGEILCSMAAFKNHCSFGFWKGSLIPELSEIINSKGDTAMGQFGKITSVKELPIKKKFLTYIKKAMKLTDDGIKLPTKIKPGKTKQKLIVPKYFLAVLKKNRIALETFDAFSYSHRKEYIEWISEAKTVETRTKRITTAIEWLADGKSRNWKYGRK